MSEKKDSKVLRRTLMGLLAAATALLAMHPAHGPGCPVYTPAHMPMIAHGGGGLPDAIYPNNRAALDLAAKHGFKIIELDLTQVGDKIYIWHQGYTRGTLTLDELASWMRAHPDIRIVLDVKTDLFSVLRAVKKAAPGMESQFIPELHGVADYKPVRAMGFADPMLAIYWMQPTNLSWVGPSKDMHLFGVAIPEERRDQAKLTAHQVYLHTINDLGETYGVYTDCLMPA